MTLNSSLFYIHRYMAQANINSYTQIHVQWRNALRFLEINKCLFLFSSTNRTPSVLSLFWCVSIRVCAFRMKCVWSVCVKCLCVMCMRTYYEIVVTAVVQSKQKSINAIDYYARYMFVKARLCRRYTIQRLLEYVYIYI